ncbi:MAG: hypothetical protein V4710_10670 [Verrucomicrobiota bacterium]
MKRLFQSIIILPLFSVTSLAADSENVRPVIPSIAAEIKSVTADKDFSEADAIQVSRRILESLAGPKPKDCVFSSRVTKLDSGHLEVSAGYDFGIRFLCYKIRFLGHGKSAITLMESINLVPSE